MSKNNKKIIITIIYFILKMMGKYQKNKFTFQKNKIQRSAYNQIRNADTQMEYEKKNIIKKYFLKLRNNVKNTLLTFFNSKK
jgi:hypothetical protein